MARLTLRDAGWGFLGERRMSADQGEKSCEAALSSASHILPTAMQTIPESMMLLCCGKCGHEADFFDFCRTPIIGELPNGTHQCPKCRKAWKMEQIDEGYWLDSGHWIPAGRRAVTIPTIL